MVSAARTTPGRRRLAGESLLLAVCLLLLTAHANVPNYKLGDVAGQDVVTPVALAVVNPEATEALRAGEARKVPLVFRFRAQAADEAEAELRAAFTSARTNFADVLYRTMKGKPESQRTIGGPLFKQAVGSARRSTRFPLLEKLAPVWARDESDAPVQAELAARLRAALSTPILADKAPPGFNTKNSITLLPVNQFEQPLTPDDVARLGRVARGNQLASLGSARSQLVKSYPTNEQAVARFVARFLTTNATPDLELTQLLRTRRTEGLAVMDEYHPGQAVLTNGQVVDRKALAALALMREKSMIGALQTQLVQEKTVAAETVRWNRWLVGGLAGLAALSIIALWRVRAGRPAPTLLPAVITTSTNPAEVAWRERALLAEARAEQTTQAVRGGLMQWMRERIVQGLFQQRKELLSTQQHAEVEMRALERRLEQLQAPLQERIATYEKRIAELERDLAVKGEENRELIKAKIILAKHQLAVERDRGGQRFGAN